MTRPKDAPTPFVGYTNETLSKCPEVKDGDEIDCPGCGGKHTIRGTTGGDGQTTLLTFSCGDKLRLAGINGRLVIGVRPDVSSATREDFERAAAKGDGEELN